MAQLRRRLRGVLVARQYVMLDYDCPNEILAQATAITPGIEGPTVSPLQTPGWSAVRAMVRAGRDEPGHGRALGARRPRHPGHQHSRLAHLTGPDARPAASLRRRSRIGPLRRALLIVGLLLLAADRLCAAVRGRRARYVGSSDRRGAAIRAPRTTSSSGRPRRRLRARELDPGLPRDRRRQPPRRRGGLRAPGGTGRPLRAAPGRRRVHRAVRRAAVGARRRPLGRRAGRPRGHPRRRLPDRPVGQPRPAAAVARSGSNCPPDRTPSAPPPGGRRGSRGPSAVAGRPVHQVDRGAEAEGHRPAAGRAGGQQAGDGGRQRALADQAVQHGRVLAADPAAGGVPQQRAGELGGAPGGQGVDRPRRSAPPRGARAAPGRRSCRP